MATAENRQKAQRLQDSNRSEDWLSRPEYTVLGVFRTYLMTPGKMLCFAYPELETLRVPLAQLTDKGLLVAERFRGAYSLTKTGYAAMNDGE